MRAAYPSHCIPDSLYHYHPDDQQQDLENLSENSPFAFVRRAPLFSSSPLLPFVLFGLLVFRLYRSVFVRIFALYHPSRSLSQLFSLLCTPLFAPGFPIFVYWRTT